MLENRIVKIIRARERNPRSVQIGSLDNLVSLLSDLKSKHAAYVAHQGTIAPAPLAREFSRGTHALSRGADKAPNFADVRRELGDAAAAASRAFYQAAAEALGAPLDDIEAFTVWARVAWEEGVPGAGIWLGPLAYLLAKEAGLNTLAGWTPEGANIQLLSNERSKASLHTPEAFAQRAEGVLRYLRTLPEALPAVAAPPPPVDTARAEDIEADTSN